MGVGGQGTLGKLREPQGVNHLPKELSAKQDCTPPYTILLVGFGVWGWGGGGS